MTGGRMGRKSIITILTLALSAVVMALDPALVKTKTVPKADDDFQLVKVAEGVYAATAKAGGLASGNAGFVVGDEGVLMVDTFFTPVAVEELLGEIGNLTAQPIKFAVN